MGLSNLLLLFALSAIWGASFMFIKIAVVEVGPLMLVALRVGLGAAGLVVFAVATGLRFPPLTGVTSGRPVWASCLILAFFGAVLPYSLINWGELHITSGAAAIPQRHLAALLRGLQLQAGAVGEGGGAHRRARRGAGVGRSGGVGSGGRQRERAAHRRGRRSTGAGGLPGAAGRIGLLRRGCAQRPPRLCRTTALGASPGPEHRRTAPRGPLRGVAGMALGNTLTPGRGSGAGVGLGGDGPLRTSSTTTS